jgi:hypothetical protein
MIPTGPIVKRFAGCGVLLGTTDRLAIDKEGSACRGDERAGQADQAFEEQAPARIGPVVLPPEGHQLPARWHHVFLDQEERAGKAFGEVQGEQIGATKRQMGGDDPKQQWKPASQEIEKTDGHAATVSAPQASGFGNAPCGDAFERQENREFVQAWEGVSVMQADACSFTDL